MDALLIAAIPIMLAAGLAVGWLLRGTGVADLRRERDGLVQRLAGAESARAVAEARGEELPPLRQMLDAVREERDAAQRDLAGARKEAERVAGLERDLAGERARAADLAAAKAAFERGELERQQAHETQLAQLKDMEAKLEARFGDLAGKALDAAQSSFLKRAEERFAQAGQAGEAKLKLLLTPVETTLKRYDEKLEKIEKDRVGSYGELREAVAQLAQGNDIVRKETARLANVLRSSPKARGRWGEEQLRNILEAAQLSENVDFTLQSSVTDGERQLRPDCVINLPGGRSIVVDVKCPLVHFEQAFDEEDEEKRQALLLQHAAAMKSYAADLGRKGYWRQFDLSPDFVIMFIPGEHFLSAAAERAPDLIETAFRNGVIVASTINMLALAKVMAGMWRQEHLAEQAKDIAEAGKELYKRLATMGSHVEKLGRNLNQATGAYNSFVGSLESQVMTQARRFEALKVDTSGKAIDLLPMVDTTVRPLTKLATAAGDDEEAEAAE
ncbi:DNA recombination protein RmuC [Sphingomonas laterariae]|uniref:DNA recombination protein RmuC homolog n=1 Tax=Edaphosphingomonas laterariae TaxID=861865 RepID=A0A239DCQ6_9SPHN|nr:DNA recombination protein RmuC [Sphingomonas laterariae]SNS30165.1 DNA recombination protein RmuC [Sphingomonas laterariae]